MLRSSSFRTFLSLTLFMALPLHAVEPKATSSKPAAVGVLIVEDEVMTDLRQIPFELLSEAKKDFAEKNFGEAAADINAAARILRAEGRRLISSDEALPLKVVADNLDVLARDVKGQIIKNERQLDVQMSKAAYLTSSHHRIHAAAEWTRKEYRLVGHDLLAAAYALESGAKWSGKELEKGTLGVVHGVRFVAGKLIQGTGWTSEEVGKAFDKIGQETERLGKKVI